MKCKKLIMPAGSWNTRPCSHTAVQHGYCKAHIPKELRGEPTLVVYRVPKYFIEAGDALPQEVGAFEVKDRSFRDAHGDLHHMENGSYMHFISMAEAIRYTRTSLRQRRDQAKRKLDSIDEAIKLVDKFIEENSPKS